MRATSLLLLCLLLPVAALAAPTFTLTERLGENWTQELVSFPVTVPGDLDLERLAVKEAAGLTRAAQFVPEAPKSRTGKVYFLVDLPPNVQETWTLIKGEEKPQTDLALEQPPFSTILQRALGASIERVVKLANDPRFRMGIIPAANIVTTAEELCSFYQCLLEEGELDGRRAFEARTVRRAVSEQAYWELDLTLGLPLRYSNGFMLGGDLISLFGAGTAHAFGHLGFTNIFSWADPERRLSVALLTSGKPVLNLEAIRLLQLIFAINDAFPKLDPRQP